MTLTTERQQFEEWFKDSYHLAEEHLSLGEFGSDMTQTSWKAWQASRELLANREAQPVAWRHDDGPFAGIAITRAKSVADSWIAKGWTVTPLYTAPPAPAVPDAVDYSDLDATSQDREVIEAIAECKGWNACRAAMLAQPVSSGYKLPDGFKLMPLEMTDEIGEAIAMEARCCGGIALDIYQAALAAAPESGN